MRRVVALGGALLAAYFGYRWRDRFEPESVRGKRARVLLTGASTGIGEQMAYHYARLGAQLLLTARREKRLQEVIETCRKVGDPEGRYYYVVADMENEEAREMVVKAAVQHLGGLDVLVLNHVSEYNMKGWGGREDLADLSRFMDVNFLSYVHLATHALPHLKQTNGSILVVSSLGGKVSLPFMGPYSASKFALDGFFGSLRQELALNNIDVSITLCVISLTGTENALKSLQRFHLTSRTEKMGVADPADTAMAIIKGGAQRDRQMFYPVKGYFVTKLRDFCPELIEMGLNSLYNKKE